MYCKTVEIYGCLYPVLQSSMSDPKPFGISGRTPTDFSGIWIRSLKKMFNLKACTWVLLGGLSIFGSGLYIMSMDLFLQQKQWDESSWWQMICNEITDHQGKKMVYILETTMGLSFLSFQVREWLQ